MSQIKLTSESAQLYLDRLLTLEGVTDARLTAATEAARIAAPAPVDIQTALDNRDPLTYLQALNIKSPEFVLGTTVGFVYSLYCRGFVPWRHKNFPYTEGQLAVRKAFFLFDGKSPAQVRIVFPIAVISAVYGKLKRLVFKDK